MEKPHNYCHIQGTFIQANSVKFVLENAVSMISKKEGKCVFPLV